MLETRKVDNNETRKVLFVNLRPLEYVTGTCYLESIPEVQVCRSSVVNNHIRRYITSRSGISSPGELLSRWVNLKWEASPKLGDQGPIASRWRRQCDYVGRPNNTSEVKRVHWNAVVCHWCRLQCVHCVWDVSGCCYSKPLMVPGGRVFVWPTIQKIQRHVQRRIFCF